MTLRTPPMTGEFDSNGQEMDRKLNLMEKASDPESEKYKRCNWCNEIVDKEKCFAMYTGVSLICEICGKDVTKWEVS